MTQRQGSSHPRDNKEYTLTVTVREIESDVQCYLLRSNKKLSSP